MVKALRYNKTFVTEITSGQEASIILDQTCFYAEQGGQQFDMGFISKVGDEVSCHPQLACACARIRSVQHSYVGGRP